MQPKHIHITEIIPFGNGLVVTLSLEAHKEMMTIEEDVRDNAYPKEDARIMRRLSKLYGLWGYGFFKVTAVLSHQGVNVCLGSDNLGGCSYYGPIDFIRPGGYYPDMRDTAFEEMVEAAPLKFRKRLQAAGLPKWTQEMWQAHADLHGFIEPKAVAV